MKFTISLKSKNKTPIISSGGNIALAIGFLLERPEAVENLFIEPRLTKDNLPTNAKQQWLWERDPSRLTCDPTYHFES